MKKVVFLTVILLAVTGAVFAQSAASILAAIPSATYVCDADGSKWVFATSGITVSDDSGSCTIPVGQMKNLKAITGGISFSFATEEHNRDYSFTINPLTAVITRDITKDGVPTPKVTMKKN